MYRGARQYHARRDLQTNQPLLVRKEPVDGKDVVEPVVSANVANKLVEVADFNFRLVSTCHFASDSNKDTILAHAAPLTPTRFIEVKKDLIPKYKTPGRRLIKRAIHFDKLSKSPARIVACA